MDAHGGPARESLLEAEALVSGGQLARAIQVLTEENRRAPSAAVERRLVRLRRAAFRSLERPRAERSEPDPAVVPPPEPVVGLPVVRPEELTPSLVRRAIQAHGSLVVRGWAGPERVARMQTLVDRSWEARLRVKSGASREGDEAWYDELEDVPEASSYRDGWADEGLLAGDSPRAFFGLLEEFRGMGVVDLVRGVLGGEAVLSLEKTTLRRAVPGPDAGWHQDGSFLGGEIESLNVWIALSKCGRAAPGLELIPRRIEYLVEAGEIFYCAVTDATIARDFPGVVPVIPEFEPGDAMIFDHLCLHRTARNPWMTASREAVENWFFAPAAFPSSLTGLLV